MKQSSFLLALELALLMVLSACSFNVPDKDDSRGPDETPAGPPTVITVDEADAISTGLPLYARSGDIGSTLSVELVSKGNEVVGAQYPTFLETEIVGRDVSKIVAVAGTYETDGRRRLVNYEELKPELKDRKESSGLSGGVHEIIQFWQASGDYLTDGVNGDFIILREAPAGNGGQRLVRGRLRLNNADNYTAAELIFADGGGELTNIVDTLTGESVQPGQGDEFQAMNLVVQGDGSLAPEPGVRLLLGDPSQILLEKRPLPTGGYFLGFVAETDSGIRASAFADYNVDNEEYRPGFQAYFDPESGFQFLYPAEWSLPLYIDGRLISSNPGQSVELSITTHPDLASGTVEALKNRTLQTFGPIQVLYEDTMTIAGERALWTVYGYEASDGPHTGALLSFAKDGTGFVIDLDGLAPDEAGNLDIARTLGESWRFRSTDYGSQIGRWTLVRWDGHSVAVPAHYQQSIMENGWRKFGARDGDTFIALLVQPVQSDNAPEELEYWLDVARDGVEKFSSSEIYNLSLAGKEWLRAEFAYVNKYGAEIWGYVMYAREGDRSVMTWTESPASIYYETEESTFQVILADFRVSQ